MLMFSMSYVQKHSCHERVHGFEYDVASTEGTSQIVVPIFGGYLDSNWREGLTG